MTSFIQEGRGTRADETVNVLTTSVGRRLRGQLRVKTLDLLLGWKVYRRCT